jgi:hypothetical protein
MQLCAKGDTAAHIAVILFLLFSGRTAFAGTLECADPPGGTITCESGQEPICKIRDGKVRGECKTPPAKIKNRQELEAWGLSEVLQEPISTQDLKKPKNAEILKHGRYGDTTFKVPEMRPPSDSQ